MPAVSPHRTVSTCGDKLLTSASLEAAGVPNGTADGFADFRALRHTYVTSLAQSGMAPKLAQLLARHSDIRLAMDRYSHLGLFDLSDALQKVSPLTGSEPSRQSAAATGTDGRAVEANSRFLPHTCQERGPKGHARASTDTRRGSDGGGVNAPQPVASSRVDTAGHGHA